MNTQQQIIFLLGTILAEYNYTFENELTIQAQDELYEFDPF